MKDVRIPRELQRAMAAEAEASREAKAKVRSVYTCTSVCIVTMAVWFNLVPIIIPSFLFEMHQKMPIIIIYYRKCRIIWYYYISVSPCRQVRGKIHTTLVPTALQVKHVHHGYEAKLFYNCALCRVFDPVCRSTR